MNDVKEAVARNGEKAEIEKIVIEEGQLRRYMEASEEALDEELRISYLKKRYESIKEEAKALALRKWEAKGAKDEAMIDKLTPAFRLNYQARVWVVRQLRLAGVQTEDPFVL